MMLTGWGAGGGGFLVFYFVNNASKQ